MTEIKVSLKGKSGILEVKNSSTATTSSTNILKLVRDKFSIKNPNYSTRRFADRIYAITPSGAFQIGLWNEIHNFLLSLAVPIKITLTEEFEKAVRPSFKDVKIQNLEGITYFDYQEDSIKEILEHGRGIAILSTGAGKSVLIGGLCKSILDAKPECKIVISVPNTFLLNQLHTSFVNEFSMGEYVTMWGDKNKPDLSKNILIANNQILTSNIKNTIVILKDYDVVIVDEVHRIGDKKTQIGKVIHNITTPHKIGLTGTLPDCIMDSWNVMGKIGPILYEKNSYEIRKKGTITDIQINIVVCNSKRLKYPNTGFSHPTEKYEFELQYIMNSEPRNNVIKKITAGLDGNVLILVDRLDYGRTLLNKLQELKDRQVFFISGDTPKEERERIINLMESTTGIVAIAMSTIFSTGVSVKNLHYAIFACIGKSGVKIVQSVGRTVRKHESKDKAVIFDIADNLQYSGEHLLERMRIYKEQKIETKVINITI